MIRHAIETDRDAVVAMMPKANLAAGFGPGGLLPLDPTPERMRLLFDQHRTHPHACLIVYAPDEEARGFLMAAMFAHPFDDAVRIAKDTGWWIEPEARGHLAIINSMLDSYEDWARDRGCAYAGMASMARNPRAGKIYERRGYVAAEIHYLKKI